MVDKNVPKRAFLGLTTTVCVGTDHLRGARVMPKAQGWATLGKDHRWDKAMRSLGSA